MFRHGPVSATAIAVCGVTSFAAKNLSRRSGLPFWTQLPFPASVTFDLLSGLCVLVVLFHMRVIERRWGSPKYLTFLLWVSAMNVATTLLLSVPRGSISALLIPLSALVTRYYLELPALGESRLPLLPIPVTDKLLLFCAIGKLILFPGPSVAIECSLSARLGLALIGCVVSYFAKAHVTATFSVAPSTVLQRFLDAVESSVVRPVWDRFLSLPFRQTLAVQRVVRRKQMPRVDAEAVPDDVLDQIAAMEGNRRPRNRIPQTGPPTPAVGPQPPPSAPRRVDLSAVRTIEELQLGASHDEIVHALEITGGNIDNAVTLLLGGSD